MNFRGRLFRKILPKVRGWRFFEKSKGLGLAKKNHAG